MNRKQELYWTLFWFLAAALFNGCIYYTFGQIKAIDFGNAFIMEKLLSFDNLFVFILIFTHFNISSREQRSILNMGIIGAIILRGLCILGGVELITEFKWLLYGLGAVLVYSAYGIFFCDDSDDDISDSKIVKWCEKIHCSKFLICLICIELSDIIFAIDSIPAVLAITTDPIIAYSSNLFAILGLRSLYFVMTSIEDVMKKMNYGIGLVLLFIGIKMLLTDFIIIQPIVSLGITFAILLTNVCLILLRKKHYV